MSGRCEPQVKQTGVSDQLASVVWLDSCGVLGTCSWRNINQVVYRKSLSFRTIPKDRLFFSIVTDQVMIIVASFIGRQIKENRSNPRDCWRRPSMTTATTTYFEHIYLNPKQGGWVKLSTGIGLTDFFTFSVAGRNKLKNCFYRLDCTIDGEAVSWNYVHDDHRKQCYYFLCCL